MKSSILLAFLLFISSLGFASEYNVPPALLEELSKNLCAPKESVQTTSDASKSKPEAEGPCLDCLSPKGAKSKGPKPLPAPTLTAQQKAERIKRELAFLNSVNLNDESDIECVTIASCQVQIKVAKNELKEIEEALDQAEKDEKKYGPIIVELGQNPTSFSKSALPVVQGALDNLPKLTAAQKSEFKEWLKTDMKNPFQDKATFELVLEEAKVQAQDYYSANKWAYKAHGRAEQDLERLEQRLKQLKAAAEKKTKKNSGPLSAEERELKKIEAEVESVLTEIMRNKGYQTCGMSIAELISIYDYTKSGYKELNGALRRGGAEANDFRNYREVLISALNRLRPYTGDVRRGAHVPDEILATYQVGAIIEMPAFTSTSLGKGFGAEHRFVIKSRTGRFIAPFSSIYDEHEVLFPPGIRLKILSREEKDGKIEFVMEEQP